MTDETQCPRCGHWQEDYDGFGVIYCEACNYCVHPSGDMMDDGSMLCDVCGERVFEENA